MDQGITKLAFSPLSSVVDVSREIQHKMVDETSDVELRSVRSASSISSSKLLRLKAVSSNATASALNCNKKKPTTLPNETVEYLKAWMMSPEHISHPYPTESEKLKIMNDTGLELKQLTNWFVNNRKRYWKPRVEARLTKDGDITTTSETILFASPKSTMIKRDVSASADPATDDDGGNAIMKKTTPTLRNVVKVSPSTRSSKRRSNKKPTFNTTTDVKSDVMMVSPIASNRSIITHLVSGHNSVASTSDEGMSCSDSEEEPIVTSSISRVLQLPIQETFNVHILRPSASSSSSIPDLSHVTILANIPSEQILRTYSNCSISYNPIDHNEIDKDENTSYSSLRDLEIMRLKKQCLSKYFFEQQIGYSTAQTISDSSEIILPCNTNICTSDMTMNDNKRKYDVHIIPVSNSSSSDDNASDVALSLCTLSPRPKYRRRSLDIWKEACQAANHVYDDELPSLEEATRLFGYTR